MKHHEIEINGLIEWLSQAEIVYASSSREHKKLVATPNGTLKVTVAGQTVWEGMQPFSAVEAYNSVTEKHE